MLPRSTFYASIGFDILEGLKGGLTHAGNNQIQIITESIGFGAEKRDCYAAAERLLMVENVTVVFAYIGQRTAQLLRPLFMAANKLLIVLDAGSSMPNEWPASPNILFHSLHNSLSGWFTSQMAAHDGFNAMGTVSGFYDGGYLQTYALARGCTDNNGTIVFNHATGYRLEDFTMLPLNQHSKNNPDACILSLFSGDYVQWFFDELIKTFPTNCPPVYAAGYTLEESVLDTIIFPETIIKGTVAWSRQIDTPANTTFINAIDDSGRAANIFSLLGWEAAMLAIVSLSGMEDNKNNGKKALQYLMQQSFEGPRGKLTFHQQTNHTLSPMYCVEIEKNTDNTSALKIISVIENPENAYEQLISEPLNDATTGWYNSYACI